MMGTCYIIGAGEFYSSFEKREGDLVIAADGGYDTLVRMGIPCDLMIGDMDSVSCVPHGVDVLRVPVDKDETDTYLCYLEGVRRGYKDFVIFGGVGGRDDHTFANYSLLIGAKMQGNSIRLVSKDYDIFAIRGEKIAFSGKSGKTLSLFAFGENAYGVSISGCKYCATGITLTPQFPLGVSNSITEDAAEVEVLSGTLLVMLER